MAFTATSKTDFQSFLKEWYRGSVAADLCYDVNTYLGLVPKNTEVRGDVYIKPIKYANISGRSPSFAVAHDNAAAAKRERWEMYHVDHYAKAGVSNKVIALSQGSDAAFQSALTSAVDSAYQSWSYDVDIDLHADGSGSRGVAQDTYGTTAANSVKVAAGEGSNFEVGMKIQQVRGGTLQTSGEEREITAVVRSGLVEYITFATDFTVIVAAGDVFILAGSTAAVDTRCDGLKAWLPGSAVTATPFNGVVRTADPARLAGTDGHKGTLSNLLITDALVQTGANLQREGARPNLALLSPKDFADLALETEARGRYAKVGATKGSISYSALEIQTGAGAVPCVSDRNVSDDTAFMLDTRTIELFSAGELPSMFDRDGNFYHRTETVDEISFYLYGFFNQSIQEPGRNSYIADLY
jgi:hypothetical protein